MQNTVTMYFDGTKYAIPEDRVEDFVKATEGNAERARNFRYDNRDYSIPESRVEEFLDATEGQAEEIKKIRFLNGTKRTFNRQEMRDFINPVRGELHTNKDYAADRWELRQSWANRYGMTQARSAANEVAAPWLDAAEGAAAGAKYAAQKEALPWVQTFATSLMRLVDTAAANGGMTVGVPGVAGSPTLKYPEGAGRPMKNFANRIDAVFTPTAEEAENVGAATRAIGSVTGTASGIGAFMAGMKALPPVAGVGLMSAESANDTYLSILDEAVANGADPETAKKYAAGGAAVSALGTAALCKMPISRIIKTPAPVIDATAKGSIKNFHDLYRQALAGNVKNYIRNAVITGGESAAIMAGEAYGGVLASMGAQGADVTSAAVQTEAMWEAAKSFGEGALVGAVLGATHFGEYKKNVRAGIEQEALRAASTPEGRAVWSRIFPEGTLNVVKKRSEGKDISRKDMLNAGYPEMSQKERNQVGDWLAMDFQDYVERNMEALKAEKAARDAAKAGGAETMKPEEAEKAKREATTVETESAKGEEPTTTVEPELNEKPQTVNEKPQTSEKPSVSVPKEEKPTTPAIETKAAETKDTPNATVAGLPKDFKERIKERGHAFDIYEYLVSEGIIKDETLKTSLEAMRNAKGWDEQTRHQDRFVKRMSEIGNEILAAKKIGEMSDVELAMAYAGKGGMGKAQDELVRRGLLEKFSAFEEENVPQGVGDMSDLDVVKALHSDPTDEVRQEAAKRGISSSKRTMLIPTDNGVCLSEEETTYRDKDFNKIAVFSGGKLKASGIGNKPTKQTDVKTPPQAADAAKELASLDDASFDAMFNEVLDSANEAERKGAAEVPTAAKPAVNKGRTVAPKPVPNDNAPTVAPDGKGRMVKKPSASHQRVAKEYGERAADELDNIRKVLGLKLDMPKPRKNDIIASPEPKEAPQFDEKTYNLLRPSFRTILDDVLAKNKTAKDFMELVMRELGPEGFAKTKPYMKRFVQELKEQQNGDTGTNLGGAGRENAQGGAGDNAVEGRGDGAGGAQGDARGGERGDNGHDADEGGRTSGADLLRGSIQESSGSEQGQGRGNKGAKPVLPPAERDGGGGGGVDGLPARPDKVDGSGAAGTGEMVGSDDNGKLVGSDNAAGSTGARPGPSALLVHSANGNVDTRNSAPVHLTPKQRETTNAMVKELIKKPVGSLTDEELNILRQYTGAGGLKSAAGKAESLNQHYTDYAVIDAMYSALERAGVPMATAFEPTAGSGNFIGRRPEIVWRANDIDATNFGVLTHLYPAAKVTNASFDEVQLADRDKVDLVISNFPFLENWHGKSPIRSLHDFCFVHSLEQVKDNGVVCAITSNGTMDKLDQTARKMMVEKADVIGCFRLPTGQFRANADTDVQTDIIVLQKRPDGVPPRPENKAINDRFVETGEFGGEGEKVKINSYYSENPDNILGTAEIGKDKLHGGKPTMVVKGPADFSKMRIDYKPYAVKAEKSAAAEGEAKAGEIPHTVEGLMKSGLHFELSDGNPDYAQNIVIRDGTALVATDEFQLDGFTHSTTKHRAKVFTPIEGDLGEKITALDSIANMMDYWQNEGNYEAARNGMDAIERYMARFGKAPNGDKALNAFLNKNKERGMAARFAVLMNEDGTPVEAWLKTTRHSGSGKTEVSDDSSLADLALASENFSGEIHIGAPDCRVTEADVPDLLETNYVLTGYEDGKPILQHDVLAYSGNIYDKIDEQNALKLEHPEMAAVIDRQIAKMEEVKPKPRGWDDIGFNGYEPWVNKAMEAVGVKVFKTKNVTAAEFNEADTPERFSVSYRFSGGTELTSEQIVLLERSLNNPGKLTKKEDGMSPEAYIAQEADARTKLAEVLQIIHDNISMLPPEDITAVETAWNRKHNSHVDPDYNKAQYLCKETFDSFAEHGINLHGNQKRWVTKAFLEGVGLNAHDVGGGKTYASIALADALRRRGIAKKPLFVVPGKVYNKFLASVEQVTGATVENGRVISLGGLLASDRDMALAKLANSNADFVFVTHDGLEHIQLSQADEIAAWESLRNEQGFAQNRSGAMQDENFRNIISIVTDKQRNDRTTLDKLGIDCIITDEAHAFKNFGLNKSATEGGLGKGIELNRNKKTGTYSLQSARSYHFRFLSEWIAAHNNSRNVFMLTATPSPNAPMEIYTMLRHMGRRVIDEIGFDNETDFARHFFVIEQVMTTKTSGSLVPQQGLTKIRNLQELYQVIARYFDRVTMDEFASFGIRLPQNRMSIRYLNMSPEQRTSRGDLQDRMRNLPSEPKEGDDNVISIFTTGRNAALAPTAYNSPHSNLKEPIMVRSFDPSDDKIEAAIRHVVHAVKNSEDGIQANVVVFVDKIDQNTGETIPGEIKRVLIERHGFKPEQIAIVNGKEITDPKTGRETPAQTKGAEKKFAVEEAFNKENGIRVVIGSTSSMGEGMNLNRYATTLIHMDMPWNEGGMQQRIGRILRQGNQHEKINEILLMQKGSMDNLSYTIKQRKADWNSVAYGKPREGDEVEVTGAAGGAVPSHEEMAIELEDDPVRRVELRARLELKKLQEARDAAQMAKLSADSRVLNKSRQIDKDREMLNQRMERTPSIEKKLEEAKAAVPLAEQKLAEAKSALEERKSALEKLKPDTKEYKDAMKELEKAESLVRSAERSLNARNGEVKTAETAVAYNKSVIDNAQKRIAQGEQEYEKLKADANNALEEYKRLSKEAIALEQAWFNFDADGRNIGFKMEEATARAEIEIQAQKDQDAEQNAWLDDMRDIERIDSPAPLQPLNKGVLPSAREFRSVGTERPKKPVSRQDLMGKVRARFPNVTIASKGTYSRSGILGWYEPGNRIIRLMDPNDIGTVCHELGHYVRMNTMAKKVKIPKAVRAELIQMGQDLYQGRRAAAGYTDEGFAELVRGVLCGYDVEAHFPNAYKWLMTDYANANPEFMASMMGLKGDILAFLSQSPEKSVEASIKSEMPIDRNLIHWIQSIPEMAVEKVKKGIAEVRNALGGRKEFRNKMIDRFAPLLDFARSSPEMRAKLDWDNPNMTPAEREWAVRNDPYILATLMNGTSVRMTANMALHGTTDLLGSNKTGSSLADAIRPVVEMGGTAIKDFETYAYARLQKELYIAKGLTTTAKPEEVDATIAKYESPEFRKALDDITEIDRRIMHLLVENGAMDEATYQEIVAANPIYMTLARIRSTATLNERLTKSGRAPIKKRKGGTSDVKDLFEATIDNWEKCIRAAQHSALVKAMVNCVEAMPKGVERPMVEVPNHKAALHLKAQNLKKQIAKLAEQHFGTDLDAFKAELEAEWPEDIIAFTTQAYKGDQRIVTVWLDGKMRSFEVKDQAIFDILSQFNERPSVGAFEKFAFMLTNGVRTGATILNPGFAMIMNPLRDTQAAAVMSDFGPFIPGVSTLNGMVENLLDTDFAKLADAMGLDMGNRYGRLGMTPAMDIAQQVAARNRFIREWRKGVLKIIANTFSVPESGTRLMAFKNAYNYCRNKKGMSHEAASMIAGCAYKEVSLDFSRMGSAMSKYNQWIPFLNAWVRELEQMSRNLGMTEPLPYQKKMDEGAAKDRAKRAGRTLSRALALITIPTLLSFLTGHEDKKRQMREMTPHELYNYIHFGNVRIPGAFSLQLLFGGLPLGAMLTAQTGDSKFIKEAADETWKIAPFSMGSLHKAARSLFAPFAPEIDWIANKRYDDRPIIPERLKRLEPIRQVTPNTSKLARIIAAGLQAAGLESAASPAMIEYLLDQHFGGLPRTLITSAETLMDPSAIGEGGDWSNIPLGAGRLFTNPNTNRLATDFYGEQSDLTRRYQSAMATAEELGRLRAMDRVYDEQLSIVNKLRRDTIERKDINAGEKKRIIDQGGKKIGDTIRAFNERTKTETFRAEGIRSAVSGLTAPGATSDAQERNAAALKGVSYDEAKKALLEVARKGSWSREVRNARLRNLRERWPNP